jgi:sirohydrochlorin ferrochelatase
MPDDVLHGVAHGSKDPRAAATVSGLMALVRSRLPLNVDVRTAYLGHAAPAVGQVLASLPAGQRVTVLPLLLTEAYHSKTDLPRALAGHDVSYGATLGPHPLLLQALERRLGPDVTEDPGRTAVVLAAAGSSDPRANATISQLAAQWQASAGWQTVVPAYASPRDAVAGHAGSSSPRTCSPPVSSPTGSAANHWTPARLPSRQP